MWVEFAGAVLAGVIFLYLPGGLLLRVCRVSGIGCMGAAPVVSLLVYSLLAILFQRFGVRASGWLLFASLFVPVLVTACIGVFVRRRGSQGEGPKAPLRVKEWMSHHVSDLALVLLYACVGILVTIIVFVLNLESADSSTIAYDDISHLAVIRSFLETGNWSSLAVNTEFDLPDSSSGYYPAAWHLLSAAIVDLSGVTNLVAANASLFLCCALFYPLGCLVFIKRLFAQRKDLQYIGAFFTLSFTAFPWYFLVHGRLVSNLLGFCFVPLMMAYVFILFGGAFSCGDRIRAGVLLVCSGFLALFTQPNAVFTVIAFMTTYLMYRIWKAPMRGSRESPTLKRKLMREGVFALALLVFLAVCYQAPPLWSVTHFKWPALVTIPEALSNILLQCTSFDPSAPLLGVLVVAGLVYACRKPQWRWVAFAFLVVCIMYVVDAGTNTRLKNYLTGFWYTDQYRVSAMVAMISYPLIVLGVGWLCGVLSKGVKIFARPVGQVTLSAILLIMLMLPNIPMSEEPAIETPFGSLSTRIRSMYSVSMPDDYVIFSEGERAFVDKVADITGEDVVFNVPFDGSLFAYQFGGVRTIYRWAFEGIDGDVRYRLIQRGLDDIARNASVRRAVDELGVKYVMMLDQGHEPFHAFWGDYSDSNWKGVLDIKEDTPGFELVLSDGDMKLYRILSEEEVETQKDVA